MIKKNDIRKETQNCSDMKELGDWHCKLATWLKKVARKRLPNRGPFSVEVRRKQGSCNKTCNQTAKSLENRALM